jgi:hypothetical protein
MRDGCWKAKLPHRLLHDCRRTAARNLIWVGVPERIAMPLSGHKQETQTRAGRRLTPPVKPVIASIAR